MSLMIKLFPPLSLNKISFLKIYSELIVFFVARSSFGELKRLKKTLNWFTKWQFIKNNKGFLKLMKIKVALFRFYIANSQVVTALLHFYFLLLFSQINIKRSCTRIFI